MPETTDPDHAGYIARMRAAVAELRETRELDEDSVGIDAHIDFAERHGLYLGGDKANLWGFGEVTVAFTEPSGGFWIYLSALVEPTGLTYDRLGELFAEDELDPELNEVSVSRLNYRAGLVSPMVHHDFIMRVFAMHSPWRKEFFENTHELMAHAMVNSGLADTIGASPTGFTAIAHMRSTGGEVIKVSMPIKSFAVDEVPIVSSPFDDAADGEQMRITDLAETYEVHRADDAVRLVLGPRVDEEQATALAFRGPSLA